MCAEKKKPISFSLIAKDILSISADWSCSKLHHSDVMAFGEVFVFRFVTVKVTFTVTKIKSLSNGSRKKCQPNCSFLNIFRK